MCHTVSTYLVSHLHGINVNVILKFRLFVTFGDLTLTLTCAPIRFRHNETFLTSFGHMPRKFELAAVGSSVSGVQNENPYFDLWPDLDLKFDLWEPILSTHHMRLVESFRLPPRPSRCNQPFSSYGLGRLTPPPLQQVVLWKYPSKCRVMEGRRTNFREIGTFSTLQVNIKREEKLQKSVMKPSLKCSPQFCLTWKLF